MNTNTYTSIVIDGQSLLLPQVEVRDVLPINDLRSNPATPGSPLVELRSQLYPVHIIDGTLAPLRLVPEQRQFIVCFVTGQRLFGLACDATLPVELGSDHLFEELPEMMRLPGSPIQALLYIDKHLHYVTAADSLIDFIASQER